MSKLEPIDAIQLAIDDHQAYAKRCCDYKFVASLQVAQRLCAKAPLLVEVTDVLKQTWALIQRIPNYAAIIGPYTTGNELEEQVRALLAKLESEERRT